MISWRMASANVLRIQIQQTPFINLKAAIARPKLEKGKNTCMLLATSYTSSCQSCSKSTPHERSSRFESAELGSNLEKSRDGTGRDAHRKCRGSELPWKLEAAKNGSDTHPRPTHPHESPMLIHGRMKQWEMYVRHGKSRILAL